MITLSYFPIEPDSFSVNERAAKALGEEASPSYQSKQPFHFGKFDDFLPEEILNRVLAELDTLPAPESSFERAQERLKTSYIPERLPPYTRNLFYKLNSRPFIRFLENLTGISGLLPDPYFSGGGIHVVANGGHLDIHADFNRQGKLNLERRLNVLIYLNKDWRPEYGGQFEIWENDMSRKIESFEPIFNRMVCFSTSSNSMHGNPNPVAHPDGVPRRSIALYYYTATWDGSKREHTTVFKPRPGTVDKVDWNMRRIEFVRDVLPPVIYRKLRGPLRRLGLAW